jgi:hypothetical protein
MDNTIVRIFDVFTKAEQACDALLAAGFARDDVQLSVPDDEAGPLQGNFTVGDLTEDDANAPYQRKYANPIQRGHFLVMVEAADGERAAPALEILQRYGGTELP